MNEMEKVVVSTPGRICLFGEDVDYMGLEVITLAINQRIKVEGIVNDTGIIQIELTDLNKKIEFKNKIQKIKTKHDYIKSVFNFYQKQLPSSFGAKIKVNSTLLIGKGLSSSSAFNVALVAFFDKICKQNLTKEQIALRAYEAEVVRLGQAGGMMDHFASVMGGLLYLECRHPYHYKKLEIKIEDLVIVDTLEAKPTVKTIEKRKKEIEKGMKLAKRSIPDFNLQTTDLQEIKKLYEKKRNIGLKRLIGVLGIRDVVREGYVLLKKNNDYEKKLTELIERHHFFQENYFDNVTEKMRKLIAIAKEAGAKACKLLGSGNGGSFLVIAQDNEKIIERMKLEGGRAYKVKIDEGLKYQ
ncbi:MAG: mevalonate kinase family protein [Candidatus Heimdallarchaeaceae archaeon]